MLKPESFNIMITDLNHHIRTLLQRELEKEKYSVRCLNSGTEIYDLITHPGPIDLIILDPELIRPYGYSMLKKILKHDSKTQIILHAYSGVLNELQKTDNITIIEKNGSSIDILKEKIKECYRVKEDRRFDPKFS